MNYGRFDATTGKMEAFTRSPIAVTYEPEGCLVREVPDNGPYYFDFDKGEPVECTDMPITIDGTTINVPTGTSFRVSEPSVKGDDGNSGVLEFNFSEPGDYEVTLFHVKHLTKEVTLSAS